jgi:hypothetical protein
MSNKTMEEVMKKLLLGLGLCFLFTVPGYTQQDVAYTENVVCSESTTTWRQTSGATVYTRPINIAKGGDYFAVSYKASSAASTPWLSIYMEQSDVLPAIDGASDENWVTPSNVCIVNEKLIDESVHLDALYPLPMKYVRFKIFDPNAPYDVISDCQIEFIKIHRIGANRGE